MSNCLVSLSMHLRRRIDTLLESSYTVAQSTLTHSTAADTLRWLPMTSWQLASTATIHFRPPDIVVDGLRFYRDSSSIFFFFVSYSPSSLNGTQPKPATYSKMTAIWKWMSKIWASPPPKNRGFNPLPPIPLRHTLCHTGLTHHF